MKKFRDCWESNLGRKPGLETSRLTKLKNWAAANYPTSIKASLTSIVLFQRKKMTRRHLSKLIDPTQTICNFTGHQKNNSRLAKFFASEMNAVEWTKTQLCLQQQKLTNWKSARLDLNHSHQSKWVVTSPGLISFHSKNLTEFLNDKEEMETLIEVAELI